MRLGGEHCGELERTRAQGSAERDEQELAALLLGAHVLEAQHQR
jgi:hypothetical protein